MRIALAVTSVLALVGTGCVKSMPGDASGNDASSVTPLAAYKPAPTTPPLSCTIQAPATCELGSVPKVTVVISNQTDADIYLVGSLAGSDGKMRYPYCYFEVTGPDGKSAVPEFTPEDPFVNALRQGDFVRVRPGESFDPYDHGHGFFPAVQMHTSTFEKAQEYRIRFVYSTKSDNIALWRGDDWDRVPVDEKRKVLATFRQVPKFEVRSNEIKVTVAEPGK